MPSTDCHQILDFFRSLFSPGTAQSPNINFFSNLNRGAFSEMRKPLRRFEYAYWTVSVTTVVGFGETPVPVPVTVTV